MLSTKQEIICISTCIPHLNIYAAWPLVYLSHSVSLVKIESILFNVNNLKRLF